MAHTDLSEQEQIRRHSLEEIRKLGIDPYPAAMFKVSHKADEVKRRFDKEEESLKGITLAGRIMSRRIMGSASFAELQDESGRIQFYIRRDDICPGEDKTMYNTLSSRSCLISVILSASRGLLSGPRWERSPSTWRSSRCSANRSGHCLL
jgi:lysyl-tRNA synthetase class II